MWVAHCHLCPIWDTSFIHIVQWVQSVVTLCFYRASIRWRTIMIWDLCPSVCPSVCLSHSSTVGTAVPPRCLISSPRPYTNYRLHSRRLPRSPRRFFSAIPERSTTSVVWNISIWVYNSHLAVLVFWPETVLQNCDDTASSTGALSSK